GYDSNRDDIFLPGIDLIVAALYYGIDLKKDVAVDYAAGTITLSNIPEKYKEKVNLATFENEKLDIMARPNASRTIVIPIDRRGQMHISFRGGQYCFPFQEILEVNKMTPAEGAANFKDKIVLVAMYYATGVGTAQDIHLSPYGDMAGIEHHAYAINTILNQDFIYEVPPVVNLLILLAVGLIMGFYQPRVATWLAFVFAIVIAAVYSVMTLFITFQVFNVLHVFPTVIILQFVQLVGFIGFRVLTEEENVKFIRNTFSKFVSQDVVEELLSNPEAIALGGSKKEISVFFSDVRGFTTISEALGPEELVNLLNEYLSEMTELIIEYRGTIDKYMGDAIMAFWGAPAKNDDHAYYACVASLAQYHALQSLQK
ncbi:MAG TPA: CHASE2 domain-containing protein, partial [Leptospiraceae bacterium]|nr:CHASE2 domain-containing protein [Leptospiraceae bacterium]